jgi:hypothetical protein
MYNVTLRQVAMEKQYEYYLLVCVCMHVCMWVPGHMSVCMHVSAYSLANPAGNVYALYCDIICGLSVSTTFFNIIS